MRGPLEGHGYNRHPIRDGSGRADFRDLVQSATVRDLRRPTDGTKWTDEQLLFHMVLGYLVVRNLLFLVRGFARLPDGASRRFAATLDAGARPFHVIN